MHHFLTIILVRSNFLNQHTAHDGSHKTNSSRRQLASTNNPEQNSRLLQHVECTCSWNEMCILPFMVIEKMDKSIHDWDLMMNQIMLIWETGSRYKKILTTEFCFHLHKILCPITCYIRLGSWHVGITKFAIRGKNISYTQQVKKTLTHFINN